MVVIERAPKRRNLAERASVIKILSFPRSLIFLIVRALILLVFSPLRLKSPIFLRPGHSETR